MFKGSLTALITPFKNNQIDEDALRHLVDFQIHNGIQGLVVCGTTGENTSLSSAERHHAISIVVEQAKKRVPVIVGCGSASTQESIQFAHEAQHLDADGILIVTPYYVKPTQPGIYAHFKTIHDASELPILIYNNPGRTIVSIDIETIQQLSMLPRIIGIKESSADLQRIHVLRHQIDKNFTILSGEDSMVPAHLMYGCDGVISFSSNAIPALCRQLIDAYIEKDFIKFQHFSQVWVDLALQIGSDVNPCGAKYAAHLLGLCQEDIRLPLLLASEKCRNNIEEKISIIKSYNNF